MQYLNFFEPPQDCDNFDVLEVHRRRLSFVVKGRPGAIEVREVEAACKGCWVPWIGFLFGKSLGTEFAKDKWFFLMGTMIASLRELLQDSWSMMKRTSEEANHYGAFGRLCCRVCLFLTNKQRFSRDNVEYQSLTEIAAIFTKELKDGPPVAAPSETVVERSVDVLTASGTEKALLQNQHLKMGEMHHGWVDCLYL